MTTRDLISPSATGSSDWINRPRTTYTAAATTDLEEEVRQSRLDRQKRRNRLSGQGVRGFPSPVTSQRTGENADLSPQHTGASATTPREKEATLRRLMSCQSQDPSHPGTRGAALLSRYGGQAGPTGVANAGSGASPVSLANFMGGKAAGPRLGKLTGDGRSAPPEASLIDQSRTTKGIALPGLAIAERSSSPGKGRGLASFLEARASGPTQHSDSATSPVITPRSPSPVRRPVSPSKTTSTMDTFRTSNTQSKRDLSPVRSGDPLQSPQPVQVAPISTGRLSPSKQSGYTLSVSPMKNVATSPIRSDDIASSSLKSITPSSVASPSWRAPTSAPAPISSAATSTQTLPSTFASPAFAQTMASDKGPTPSLTRLKGKGMVGQRLKEAKEREEAAAAPAPPSSTSPASQSKFSLARTNSNSGFAGQATGSTPRWAAIDTSPTKEEVSSRRWTPHRAGTALPGLSASSPGPRATSPTRSSTAPSRSDPVDDRYDVAPVRLPGLGGMKSPFGASAGRASPDKEESNIFGAEVKKDAPLEHLTKGRARGPAKRNARGPSSAAPELVGPPRERSDAIASDNATSAVNVTSPSVPLRNTSGKRIVVLISGSGSNLQALIDATLKNGPLSHAQISYVLSNRKAAFGLQRAATSNPPIATKVLALKTWQNRNNGGTREQYDEVLAKAVLDAEGCQLPGYDETAPSRLPPPDLIVLAGFMHIVSPQFLRALGHRTELSESEAPSWKPSAPVPIINLHPALPGAFDGANAIGRAFEAFQEGQIRHTGIMVHEVIAEVDRGAPILTKEVPIFEHDTLETLETRMHEEEHRLIVEGTRLTLARVADRKTQTQLVDQLSSPSKVDDKKSAKTWGTNSTSDDTDRSVGVAASKRDQRSSQRSASPSKTARQAPVASHVQLELSEQVSGLPSLSAQQKSILDAIPSCAVQGFSKETISVEVLSIQQDGSTSSISSDQANILYEMEMLAVIHRFRSSPSSQTLATELYARVGSQVSASPAASQKLSDLARRFGTTVINARQGREDLALARALGGILETRQGSRRGWDKGDSLMWRISEQAGVVFVDQVDLSTSNLCSAYSYLISIVRKVFTWQGRGSTALERDSVIAHAKKVLGPSVKISEQQEGTEDQVFWTFLDKSGGYSSAWHHRHRNILPDLITSPRLFHMVDGTIQEHKGGFTSEDVAHDGIALLVLPAEVYLLAGENARSKRREIALALSCAEYMGKALAARRLSTSAASPSLPVHALIYPTLEPRDMVASLRYWNQGKSGHANSSGARRMNVVSFVTAKRELLNHQGKWRREVLKDETYLPLGIGPQDFL